MADLSDTFAVRSGHSLFAPSGAPEDFFKNERIKRIMIDVPADPTRDANYNPNPSKPFGLKDFIRSFKLGS